MHTVTIVGVGRVGGAFALGLSNAGFDLKCLVTKDVSGTREFAQNLESPPEIKTLAQLDSIDTDILFITTQDSKIRDTAESLAALPYRNNPIVFHASGALSSDELEPLSASGWTTGSLHPLISISTPLTGASRLKGAYFAVEGSRKAIKIGFEIAEALRGRPFEIDKEQKTLYHASAVVACGHLVALLETASRMLARCGMDYGRARKVLMPLIQSTIENYEDRGPGKALTGPFARGDSETVEHHLEVISALADPDIDMVYRLLGKISADIAAEETADNDRLTELRKIILLDNNNPK